MSESPEKRLRGIDVYDRDVTPAELREAAKVIETYYSREHPNASSSYDKININALELRAIATKKALDDKAVFEAWSIEFGKHVDQYGYPHGAPAAVRIHYEQFVRHYCGTPTIR